MSPDNLRAMALMTAGMGLFAVEDFLLKGVGREMPVGQMLLLLALGGAAIFGALCRVRGVPLVSRAVLDPLVAVRNVAEGVASVCYVSAITLVPLSLAAAILQATPIFVTAGAAIWLRETVGWRRWAAVAVGLAGVLLILRPGFEGFRPPAVLALLAALALAVRDVASRRIAAEVQTVQLSFWAYLALIPGALLLMAVQGTDSAHAPAWIGLGGAIAVGALAYATLTAATRLGDVSAVIPFRYTRLVFAMALGGVFLGERPDAATWAGAVIVVGSGLYAWLRERRHTLSPGRA